MDLITKPPEDAIGTLASLATDHGDLTHCGCCQQPFGPGRRRWTIAAWFGCGALRKADCVCLYCRDRRRPYTPAELAKREARRRERKARRETT